MSFFARIGATLSLYNGFVAAAVFNAPVATLIWNGALDAHGWTPRPTAIPRSLPDLFRRQQDLSFCGFLEGDPEYPVTCQSSQSCRFASDLGWWGCCTGTRIADCHVVTTCIESASISSCLADSSCSEETLFTACTDATEASCMQLNTVIFSTTYRHYECASARTTYEVLYTTAEDVSSVIARTRSSEIAESSTSRFRSSSRATAKIDQDESTRTSEEAERSTGESFFSISRSSAPRTTDESTPSADGSPTIAPSSTISTGAARKTAEAVVGVVGGVAGLLVLLA